MKKYKGFTLVELLAIMTILGVMVILVVPQIGGSINAKKEKELEKIIDIIENAGKAYHTFNNDEYKIPMDTLVSEKYLSNDLTNPMTNEKLDGCVRVSKDMDGIFNYRYTPCESVEVSVTIDLRGGSSTQFLHEITQNTYSDSTKIKLVNPTKEKSDFSHWEVVKGNSYINENDNTLIIGDTETIVYAIWESWPTLTLDLNGGTIENNFGGIYKSGTTIELTNPTRDGYKFTEWEVTSGNGSGIISGNTFTMGSSDTTLRAKWIDNYTIPEFTYTGNYEIVDDSDNVISSPATWKGNWKIRFLSSGVFSISNLNGAKDGIDVFLVGGGGNGGSSYAARFGCYGYASGGGGGGGGFRTTAKKVSVVLSVGYTITIGGSGGNSSGFGYSASGGSNGASGVIDSYSSGGSGGSTGGMGGYNAAGGTNGSSGGYEFGETSGRLYGGGGGGGHGHNGGNNVVGGAGSGGSGGGGCGNKTYYGNSSCHNGTANTGGGGGGGSYFLTTTAYPNYSSDGYTYLYGNTYAAGTGGSGIVIIRNAR